MTGDPSVGAALRVMRQARGLTLAAVARSAGCAVSLISQVESGHRSLLPWLAEALDAVYGAGGSVAGLAGRVDGTAAGGPDGHEPMVMVRVESGDRSMLVSRGEALTLLSLGVVSGSVATALATVARGGAESEEVLARSERALAALVSVGRHLPGGLLSDTMIGNLVVLEGLRQSGPPALWRRTVRLQARYAESLSWLSEEAGDAQAAGFWTDRCGVWAHSSQWAAMLVYTFVRRSMMALSFSGAVPAAMEQARVAFEMEGAPSGVRGLAAKQLAFGYALAGRAEDSERALEVCVRLLQQAESDDDPRSFVGQRSVVGDDLQAIFRGTCQVYLGNGAHGIEALQPVLARVARGSSRTGAITAAKLARAWVDVGDPGMACARLTAAAELASGVGSASAWAELQRARRGLLRWSARGDVREVRRLLSQRLARVGERVAGEGGAGRGSSGGRWS